MEPQIIDYYNEIPSGINVIDKMNEELDDLQKKYDALEKKYHELEKLEKKVKKFKTPFITVETKEEYKKYDDILLNGFKGKITKFLSDEETGVFALIKMRPHSCLFPDTLFDEFRDSYNEYHYYKGIETCKEKIINELDNITNNKNKEWCELRINIAFETCLKNKPALRYRYIEEQEIIDDLIHHIYNDENNEYLPESYTENCSIFFSSLEHNPDPENFHGSCLYHLIAYKCKRCGMYDQGKGNLMCWNCESDEDSVE